MSTLKLVLLSFVGLCVGQDPKNILDVSSPANLIEAGKELVKFAEEEIFEGWLRTESLTCTEVDKTVEFMKKNIKSDLAFVLAQASNQLKRPTSNPEEEDCMNDIKGQIESAINEGVDEFTQCTTSSMSILPQEKNQIELLKKEYQEKVVPELNKSISSCLEGDILDVYCFMNSTTEIAKQMKTVHVVFERSKCMAFFQSFIINCTSDVYEKTIRKNIELLNSIEECVGYSAIEPVKLNIGAQFNKYLANYSQTYFNLDERYLGKTMEYFEFSYMWKRKKERNLVQHYIDEINKDLKYYFLALNKTLKENRSADGKICYNEAIGKIRNLIDKESILFVNCHRNLDNLGKLEIDTFKTTIDDFNEKFIEAGNVALLRCIRQQPQKAFDLRGIILCADLAMNTIKWEWKTVEEKLWTLNNLWLSTLMNSFMYDFMKNPCDPIDFDRLNYEKLLLDAETILYDCQRCLGTKSGHYYAVTTQIPELRPVTEENLGTIINQTGTYVSGDNNDNGKYDLETLI